MLVTNQTTQDIYFGPLHLAAGVGQTLTVDDTSDTSLYLTNDAVADAVNNASVSGKIIVSSAAAPFPRPTGTPELVHGDGSPEGLVYSPRGSVYMRGDASATWVLYIKTTPVTQSTGWVVVDTTGASVPTGTVSSFAGVAAPTGWLICDGSPYSQTTYAALFAAIVASKGTVTVTIASPGVFTLINHGLIVGDTVYLETTGALPTGLTADTPYYVIAAGLTSNAFELSTTRAGTAINTTGSQSGSHTLFYAPYANSNMSAGSFTLPDLRGRVAVGYSGSGGATNVAALGANDGLAENVRNVSHHHTYTRPTASNSSGSNGNNGNTAVSNTSGDTNNTDFPAYVTLNHIIKI
ncbi:MAG TPA: phage tail protein [Gaiellaceae bacterium]|nr:phage tail protein [Gaiellaceae bacterium]